MGSLDLLTDWTEHIPCDSDFVVPLKCRPTFLDYTTFTLATRLGRLSADPTGGHYTDKEGGLYYRTTTQRLYYRNATVWVPLGLGDGNGDVTFDPAGTAQQDNGVARWSTNSKYIQGSVATLDDNGNFETPGTYQANDTTTTNFGLLLRNTVNSPTTSFSIDIKGKQSWNSDDAYLERIAANEIGCPKMDATFSLRNGNSQLIAHKHLAGAGDVQGVANYRTPIVPFVRGHFGTQAYGSAGNQLETIIDYSVPARTLWTDGDCIRIRCYFETANDALAKALVFTVHTPTPIAWQANLNPSVAAHGYVELAVMREAGDIVFGIVTTTGESSITGGGGFYQGPADYLDNSAFNITVESRVTTTGATPADEIIIPSAQIEILNF